MKAIPQALDPRSRAFARWALRATGPLLLAVLLLRVVDFAQLRAVLDGIRLPWALAALATVQLIILFRAFRWAVIHHAFGLTRAPMSYHVRLAYATGFAMLVLPQMLSPFSRVALLLQDGQPADRAGAGSAIEKLLELSVYAGFGLYGAIFLASTFGGLVWWILGLTLMLFGAGIGAYLGRSWLSSLARALIARVPGIDVADVVRHFKALQGRALARLFAWSLAIALAQATLLFLLARSLGVGLSYPFMTATWGVIALSMLLPLSISGIGTREAILAVAFSAAGESADAAVALGLLTLATVAIGSSPGAIEWLRRFLTDTRKPSAPPMAPPTMTAAGAHPQGERSA